MKFKECIIHSSLLKADIKISKSKDSLEHRAHKYIAKVPIGGGKYRYFYTQAELDAYNRAKKAGENTVKDTNLLKDYINTYADKPLGKYEDGEPWSKKSLTKVIESEGGKDVTSEVRDRSLGYTLLKKKKKAKGNNSKKNTKKYDYYWR